MKQKKKKKLNNKQGNEKDTQQREQGALSALRSGEKQGADPCANF
jgi:hypothetical protein